MARDERTWLKTKVDRLLRSLLRAGSPIWWVKIHGGPMQRAGVPDYLLCIRGRFFGLEIKHPDEPTPTPDPRQVVEIKGIRFAGGDVLVANSLDQVRTWMQANGA